MPYAEVMARKLSAKKKCQGCSSRVFHCDASKKNANIISPYGLAITAY